MRNLCEAKGCDDVVVSHGLCARHWKRVQRRGSVDAGRPEDWGQRTKHPLYDLWVTLKRGAGKAGYDPRWTDFWLFIEDVGLRPDASWRLYRIDRGRPFSKDNAEWRAPILEKRRGDREAHAAYQRALYVKRPDVFKRAYLRRHYGISLETYNEMLEAQRGLCAICRQSERRIHAKTGDPMMLAVDHDHATGKCAAFCVRTAITVLAISTTTLLASAPPSPT